MGFTPSVWKWIERTLFAVAVVSLGHFAWASVEAALYQSYENRELDAILASGPSLEESAGTRPAADNGIVAAQRLPEPGSVIGRIEIPRLDVSVVIRAGSDARTLKLAVGHIPGTAVPGELGNIGLAGHRDTFFRRLRNIRTGDRIDLVTASGTFHYYVERTFVVDPTDVEVLDPTPTPALTLVTCYPFTFIGAAPQRFIVRAQLDPAPE